MTIQIYNLPRHVTGCGVASLLRVHMPPDRIISFGLLTMVHVVRVSPPSISAMEILQSETRLARMSRAGGQWGDSFAYLTLNGLILGLYSKTVKPDQGDQ